MADPFSVAGSGVGVISLGISACQGLLQYYASWKNYKGDIAATLRSLEGLMTSFQSLEPVVESPDFRPELAGQLEAKIMDCKDGVENLRKKLKKIKKENPISLQEKALSQLHRISYPFKQSTLAKLQETVSDLRDNVGLAMNILQL
jgi:ankyrin repeat domain-containing protein 50